jgi:hypothetical protein
VDLWIDFGDLQVFPTAKNFVAILVGTATVRRRKTFVCRAPRDDEWPPEDVDCCLQGLSRCRRHYGELWHTGVKEEVAFAEKVTRGSTPLGSLVAGIGVGIQTSADKVYLFKEHVTNPQDGLVCVFSRHLGKRIQLELAATKLLAKGSASLVPYALRSPLRVLWPYGDDGLLLEETVLREQFPHAWRYLNRCKKALCARESRKFDGPAWWQFGRSQGLACWEYPKLTLPSIMKPAIAYLDQETGVAVTASGAGGGGAWVITPQDQDRVRLEWLLAVLNSEVIWRWLRVEGDPKLWGWRGVDRSVIERIPVAVPNRRTQNTAARIVKKLLETQEEDPGREQHISKLDSLVRKAYGVL